MKSIKSILSLFFLSAIFSCSSVGGSNEANSDADSTEVEATMEEDYSGMKEVDLTEYGITASIMVPGDEKGKLEVEET